MSFNYSVQSQFITIVPILNVLYNQSANDLFYAELVLMFQLMDRVRGGVDPMIANLESYIVTTGLDDMKASADTITSVRKIDSFSLRFAIFLIWECRFPPSLSVDSVPLIFLLQDSEKYVDELLTLFNRFSKLVKEAFNDDPRFLTARDKVFFAFVIKD